MKFVDEKENKNKSGIYVIKNVVTGCVYIGQTSERFQRRYWHHNWCLNNNKHDNDYLQASWNKHGGDKFEFAMLECVGNDLIDERETYWIQYFRARGLCYNIQDGGQPKRLSDYTTFESRKLVGAKNRERMLGSKLSEETKRKMSETRTGLRVHKYNDVFTDQQAHDAKTLLMDGYAPKDVATMLNVNYRTINNLLSNNTYKHVKVDGWNEFQQKRIRKRHNVNADEVAKMKALYEQGFSLRKIGELTGCTGATVKKYIST